MSFMFVILLVDGLPKFYIGIDGCSMPRVSMKATTSASLEPVLSLVMTKGLRPVGGGAHADGVDGHDVETGAHAKGAAGLVDDEQVAPAGLKYRSPKLLMTLK